MLKMIIVPASPGDPEMVPWHVECDGCALLRCDPDYTLPAWIALVDGHMQTFHDVWLITPPDEV